MPSNSLYQSVENDESAPDLDLNGIDIDEDLRTSLPELFQDDLDSTAVPDTAKNIYHSKDLVRLYLQEIGKVRLLLRDEEISEAKNVQRYMQLLELRTNAAAEVKSGKSNDLTILHYVESIEIHDRLTAQLGHRPSLERWASTAGISLAELKPRLAAGKQRWAELAQVSVTEIDAIQLAGTRAKEHMIKANLRLVLDGTNNPSILSSFSYSICYLRMVGLFMPQTTSCLCCQKIPESGLGTPGFDPGRDNGFRTSCR